METASRTPSQDRAVDRRIVVGLTIMGLVANVCMYVMVNIVSWMGGPLGFITLLLCTIIAGGVLWHLPAQRKLSQSDVVVLATTFWFLGSPIAFMGADGIQQWLWIKDTESVAREYGRGELPPDCRIKGTYRGSVHTPIECKGTVAEVAAWYRERLDRDWVQSSEDRDVIFIRDRLGLPDQKIVIYRDFSFGNGTCVLVSPTQTN